MTKSSIDTTIGLCVVALTKHLMKKYDIKEDVAYGILIKTDLYTILIDSESRLYLETNTYLCDAVDKEIDSGKDIMYTFINEY